MKGKYYKETNYKETNNGPRELSQSNIFHRENNDKKKILQFRV